MDNGKVCNILIDITTELHKASDGHPPMHSLHEAAAVIREEFDEFWDEVKKNPHRHPDRNDLARKELVQLAAMSIRALHDVL